MDSLMRGRGMARRASILLVATISGFTVSYSVARGGDESDDGAYGTPLAVTGIPIARENSSLYGLGLWSFDEPGTHGHGHGGGDSVIHAWLWEQGLAFRTHGHGGLGYGTLGYGEYGLTSGFYGFGLSFHRGYGYGGRGLGTGADGGYPFYGGIGYPALGDAYPGVVWTLVVEQPAASVSDPGAPGYAGDFGPYTGVIPYPETLFAPYAAAAAATGSSTGPSSSVPTPTRAPARVP
jgi:hypothetical protein